MIIKLTNALFHIGLSFNVLQFWPTVYIFGCTSLDPEQEGEDRSILHEKDHKQLGPLQVFSTRV